MSIYAEDFDERNIRHNAEVAALNEEIDRLLAALKAERERSARFVELQEQVARLTVALDDALAIVRARREIDRIEREAGL